MKKWISILGILIIVFGAGAWYVFRDKSQPVTNQAVSVAVQKGKLDVKVKGSGSTQSVTNEDITADSNKVVESVLVSANEVVKKGQELITFTDGSDSIVAPADGTITSISVQAGDHAAAGKAVAHITNYSDLQTVIQVDELDIPKVQVGQSVTLKVNSFPDTSYTGKVTDVAKEGTVSNGVSSFNVTIHIDDPKDLKIGMTTEASILTDSKDNVLYVPVEAVHTRGDQKFVLVQSSAASSNGKTNMQRKVVKTGIHNEDSVEITEGLQEGEHVQLPIAVQGNGANNSNNKQRGFMMSPGGGMGGGFGGGGMNRNRAGGRG
ncbi:efflux RND transporter periplasmic adaptor subunit [Bacillus cereus group sp. BfR-BA-01380]|uniref:efflux RND transporter periplasmic adaptor subunit n=1 Tax=Bacillus cereus group sp. BfR-BA-01380 TaxID=2920324 RepID=UPI001F56353E|nr:efflux RND transporter periplasmic adaptor subunit [Bacillus cereus group sp. BfR-BA-01380]